MISKTKTGFLTIAYGGHHYLRMGNALVKSYKRFGIDHPFAVVTDQLDSPLLDGYDIKIPFRPDYGRGLTQKLHVDLYSPFDETLFVDSDGLFYKDPSRLLEMYRAHDEFAIRGFRYRDQTTGVPGLRSVENTFAALGISRVPFLNSGLFYFRKGARQSELFETARELSKRSDELGLEPFNGNDFNDENVFALAMEVAGVELLPWRGGEAMAMYDYVGKNKVIDIRVPSADFTTYGNRVSPIFLHYCAGAQHSFQYIRECCRLDGVVSSGQYAPQSTLLWQVGTYMFRSVQRKLKSLKKRFHNRILRGAKNGIGAG